LADHLQQRDRIPDEGVLDVVERPLVLVGDPGFRVVNAAAARRVAVQAEAQRCPQRW